MYRIAFAACIAASAVAGEEIREMTVAAGEEIIIAQPHHWRESCKSLPVEVVLTELPKLGQIVVTEAAYEIGDFATGRMMTDANGRTPSRCLGRTITALRLLYRADDTPGADTLAFSTSFSNGMTVDLIYQITVE